MDSAALRIKPVIRLLRKHYPRARTALEFGNPLQILVATILAAQCTDERVNKITPGLFQKYPTADAFAGADRAELEQEIRSAGFFRNKAKSIIGAARRIVEEYGGAVPDSMDGARHASRSRPQNGQHRLVRGLRQGRGDRRRHPCRAAVPAPRAEPARRPGQGRARPAEPSCPGRTGWISTSCSSNTAGPSARRASRECPECFLRRLCPSAKVFISGGKPK